MTEPFVMPPDLIDPAGERWVKLHPRRGEVACPLNAEDLAGLAAYYRSKGQATAESRARAFEMVRDQLDGGNYPRLAPTIRVIIHGVDDGVDQIGRKWVEMAPTPGTALIAVTAGEAKWLAETYAETAAAARDEDNDEFSRALATRGLELREVAHAINPELNMREGHPRLLGVKGSA